MIGVLLVLITLIRAPIPPRSPAPTPSTSSIMITLFLVARPPIAEASAFSLVAAFATPDTLK